MSKEEGSEKEVNSIDKNPLTAQAETTESLENLSVPEIASPPGQVEWFSPKTSCSGGNAATSQGGDLGFLDLIYGVLFNPVKTFRRMAGSIPTGKTVLIFSTVKVLSLLVFIISGFYSQNVFPSNFAGGSDMGMIGVFKIILPALAILGLFVEFIKWFLYSGILYFLAELFGGRGRALGVLATTGLASIPSLVFMPFQILISVFGGEGLSGAFGVLFWLATIVWGAILVVLGLRETQELSTSRALAVTFAPAVGAVVLLMLFFILILAVAAPLGMFFQQFGDIGF